MTLTYHCARCGEQFETERRQQRYCSNRCLKHASRPRPITKRYPFAAVRGRLSAGLTNGEIAARLSIEGGRVQYNQVSRWDDYGLMHKQACDLAARIDAHPYELWPEMVEDDVTSMQKSCNACGTPYWPNRRTQRWCSTKCRDNWKNRTPEVKSRKAAYARRRWQTDGEYRERQLSKKRAEYSPKQAAVKGRLYRAAHKAELAARHHAYYLENKDQWNMRGRERYQANRLDQLAKQRNRDMLRRLAERGWASGFAVPVTYEVMRGAADAMLCENPKRNAGFVARELKRLKPRDPEIELEMAA